ncbi:MAG: hypothetical protein EOP04_06930 [Proteobacteria bacterium]|nr:MAG: hypothetical protein EOP04_06930 [Pseudomonadota bacterium]
MAKYLKQMMTAVWLGAAVFEAFHDVSGKSWGVLSPLLNWAGVILVPLWITSALAIWSVDRNRIVYLALGNITLLTHGIMLSSVSESRALVFVLAALVIFSGFVWLAELASRQALIQARRDMIFTERAQPKLFGLIRPQSPEHRAAGYGSGV